MSVMFRGIFASLALLVVGSFLPVPVAAAAAQISGSVAIQGDSTTKFLYTTFFEPVGGGTPHQAAWQQSTFTLPRFGEQEIPAGDYRVRFRFDMLDGVERYFVDGSPAGAPDSDGATVVTIGGPQAPPQMTMVMPQIGRVVGQVTDGQGNPIPGLTVAANQVWPHIRALVGRTDTNGQYDLGYLQAGQRVIDVFGSGDLAGRCRQLRFPRSAA